MNNPKLSVTHSVTYENNGKIVYLNLNATNNNNGSLNATIDQKFGTTIVENPSEFNIAVARFNIPSNYIPVWDFTKNTYYVTMSYNGIYVSTQVINPTYSIAYNQDAIVRFMNRALLTCYNNLVTAAGPLPANAANAPFMTFDPTTQIFAMNYQQGGYYPDDPNNPNTSLVYVYFNTALMSKFWIMDEGFNGYNVANNANYTLYAYSKYGTNTYTYNTVNYNQMKQCQANISSIYDIVSLFFTSSLGVRPENVPVVNNGTFQNGQISTLPILTDFDLVDNNTSFMNGYLQYQPSGLANYRYANLTSRTPIDSIYLNAQTQDFLLNNSQLILPAFTTMSIKLVFVHKSIMSSII